MRTRKTAHTDVPSDGDELESWIRDLGGSFSSARAERLDRPAEHGADTCASCKQPTTGEIDAAPDTHLDDRLIA
jgi:hypothetical protein